MTLRACGLQLLWLPCLRAAWVTLGDLQGDLELDQEKVESGDSKAAEQLASAAQITASSSRESHEQRSVHAVHNEERLSQLVENAKVVSKKAVANFSVVDLRTPPSDSLVQGLAKELHGGTTVIMYKLGDGMGSDPNAPKEMTPEEKEEVSKANGGKGDSMLTSAWKHIREIRANSGNVVASVVSVVDPENCLTKLLYLLYRFNDEDDYPYFPRKLGACDIGWNFQTGSVAGGVF
ncbi:unnamed protein product [Symbiodinium microadriaticum]|nr:unnamed protein product [Symbiodinium microadriaticum]CAE7901871.1 unnamed protein product [Symbiodinium sp. KB8]